MTSYRKIEANRRNALKSTGPKTKSGKEVRSSMRARAGVQRKVGPAIDPTAAEISPPAPPPVKDLAPVGISSADNTTLS